MTLREYLIKLVKENMPVKEPEVKPVPRTKPGEKPAPRPIRRPLTPPKEAPKPAPKAEGMHFQQKQWDTIEQEVMNVSCNYIKKLVENMV
jgi:hypothetical protein